MSTSRYNVAGILLAALLLCVGTINAQPPEIDKKADELLKAMSAKMASAKTLRLVMKRTIEAGLMTDSNRPETVEGEVLIHRPNKLAARITTRGHRHHLVYDGARVSILDAEANRYASAAAARDIDTTLKMLDEDYGYALPLADFLFSDPYGHFIQEIKEAGEEFQSCTYEGLVTVANVKFHHIAFREEYVHYDLWIDAKTHLPLRLVVKAMGIEGHPKLVLEFLSIDLNPRLDKKAFAFDPPAGAKQISMPKVKKEDPGQQVPKMKMTTDIPASITAPDTVKTSIGTLEYFDGVPTEATVKAAYDYLDRSRAVNVFINSIPAMSMYTLREGQASVGADSCNRICIWDNLMDSKSLLLTGNTSTMYAVGFLDLDKDGPTVIDLPPGMLGILDDMAFRYMTDLGVAGPDKGKGGKFLVLPPGYDGDVPEDYFVVRSKTNGVWVFMRGYLDKKLPLDKAIPAASANIRNTLKVYPLAKKDNPPKMEFINVSGKKMNTVLPNDFSFFQKLHDLIQNEPDDYLGPEAKGMMAAIGIEKGKPFKPDARMKKALTDAAAIGNAAARAISYFPRDPGNLIYGKKSAWIMAYANKDTTFTKNGAYNLDARALFHFGYICVSPAMAVTVAGKGSDYGLIALDSQKRPLDGSKTYKLHLPPNPPVKDFWALTMYDTQTRSQLQTDQQFPTLGSQTEGIRKNADGSCDIYFAPKPPAGKEGNWLQTIPGKSWWLALRMYGPLKPWIDQTWRPGEIELVD